MVVRGNDIGRAVTGLSLYAVMMLCGGPLLAGFMASAFARRLGVTDTPNERSGHVDVTATAGGVSIITAFLGLMALVVFWDLTAVGAPYHLGLIALAFAMAGLGFYDDIRGARALPKLLFMMSVAALSTALIDPIAMLPLPFSTPLILPAFIGIGGAILWIVVVINAVNFVDGANGMLVANMGVASAGLLALSLMHGADLAALWSLGLLLGVLGFAPFNVRRRAQIFAGDVGALTAGFILSVAGLLLLKAAPDSAVIYALPMLMLPILIDVFMTLIRRARAGQNILQAHNQHLFQRQIQARKLTSPDSDLPVTAGYCFASIICALSAVILSSISVAAIAIGLAVFLILGIVIYGRLYARAMAILNAAKQPS